MPDIRTPKQKVELDMYEFIRLAEGADIEFVGRDTEYVPDSPHLQKDYPNTK